MTGLFFCLASAEDAGLLFCSATIQPHTNVYSTFCACPCNFNSQHSKTAHKALQWLFLRLCPLNHPRYQTDTNGYNTTYDTLEHVTAAQRLQHVPDTSRHAETLHSSAQTAYYNNVYKGAGVRRLLWIHARRCNIPQTIPARRGQLLPCVDRWQVLTRCQQYRPGAPAEGSASPPAPGQPGGGLDASHARRLAIWHRVSGQGAPGQSGTFYPAGQSSGMDAAGGAELLAALAASLFGLSPDS